MEVVGAFKLDAAERNTVVAVVAGTVVPVVVGGRVDAGRAFVGATATGGAVAAVDVVVSAVVEGALVALAMLDVVGKVGRGVLVATMVVDVVVVVVVDVVVVVVVDDVDAPTGAASPISAAAAADSNEVKAPHAITLLRPPRCMRFTILRPTVRL